MLDAEVVTKAEASASTICIIGYKSLLLNGLDVSYGDDVDDGLNVLDDLNGLDMLVSSACRMMLILRYVS